LYEFGNDINTPPGTGDKLAFYIRNDINTLGNGALWNGFFGD